MSGHERLLDSLQRATMAGAESGAFVSALPAIALGLGFEVACVWRPGPDRTELRMVSGWQATTLDDRGPFLRASAGLHPVPGAPIVGQVWEEWQPVWLSDLAMEPRLARADAAGAASLRSAFAFPLSHRGDRLGVVEMFSSEVRDADRALLDNATLIGEQLGAALAFEYQNAGFAAMATASPRGVIVLDWQMRITYCNPSAGAVFGWPEKDLFGREFSILIHQRDMPRVEEALRDLEEGLGGAEIGRRNLTVAGVRGDGRQAPVDIALTAWWAGGVTVFGVQVLALEADASETSQHGIQRMLALSPIPSLLLYGPEHRVVMMNAPAQRLLSRTDHVGRRIEQVVPSFEEQGYRSLLDLVYRSRESVGSSQAPIWLERGPLEWQRMLFSFHFTPTRDHAGVVDGILVQLMDVTEQVAARARLDELDLVYASLSRVAGAICNGEADLDEVLQMVASEAASSLSVDAVVIARFENGHSRLVGAWSDPSLGRALKGGIIPAGRGHATDMVRAQGAPVHLDYADARPDCSMPDSRTTAPGPTSFERAIAVPVAHRADSWGAIAALNADPSRTFTPDTEGHLTMFGRLVGLALSAKEVSVPTRGTSAGPSLLPAEPAPLSPGH